METNKFQKEIRKKMIDHDIRNLEGVRELTTLSRPTFYRMWNKPELFRMGDLLLIMDGLEMSAEERGNILT